MARGSPKTNTAIQRLLDERRQYEAFITRLDSAADATPERAQPRAGVPPRPQVSQPEPRAQPQPRKEKVDELAFLKSVTEDEKGGAPSARRASGAQFQPVEPTPARSNPPAAAAPVEAREQEPNKTLKCQECGTMNLPTEWYCEQCGAELAAL